MTDISSYADNTVSLHPSNSFAAILGANPSSGARSPVLWNAAFEGLELPTRMIPLDVSPENLDALLSALEIDERFLGGAVAVPYKQRIAEWLSCRGRDRLSSEARAIGAINCLYRNADGVLCASNTDGEGALRSLESVRSLDGIKVLLIGAGGAGKAVSAYLATAVGPAGKLVISTRNEPDVVEFSDRLGSETIKWPPPSGSLDEQDILVNCTSIGSFTQMEQNGRRIGLEDFTPLAELDGCNEANSVRLLREPDRAMLVFDIIYDPSPTKLLKLAQGAGHDILDGGEMNLQQAVLAFKYAVNASEAKMRTIRSSMVDARSRI